MFGKQFKREPIHFGLCNGLIARSCKLEKTRLDLTMLEQEAWRVYCYSCIPTNFPVYHFTAWRVVERFFTKFFSFLFDNTCRCYLTFTSLYHLLFAFNYCCVVIKVWLRVVCLFGYSLYLSFRTYIV